MSLNPKTNENLNFVNEPLALKGWWQFSKDYSDASANGNNLVATGNPSLVSDSKLSGAVRLDGTSQWLGTQKPVVDTEGSYTIAAWVRLDSSSMNGKLTLKHGEHALTAVSQESPTHSAFYLGLRQIDKEQPDGVLTSSLRWNFTVSPIDGSETGLVEWQHAHGEVHLDNSALDKWFLLVGVCDASKRTNNIYVPNVGEKGIVHWPDGLVQLRSEGGLQVGKGRWLGRNVDQWPGSIGPIKVFSGAMTAEDAKILYTQNNF